VFVDDRFSGATEEPANCEAAQHGAPEILS
jgi:hypothetical protein